MDDAGSWGTFTKICCYILNFINLSPGFLFIQRILRHQRVKRVLKLINDQQAYRGIGIKKDKSTAVLKWTLTSDKSTLMLDVVIPQPEDHNLLNWELPFPQKFIICNLI